MCSTPTPSSHPPDPPPRAPAPAPLGITPDDLAACALGDADPVLIARADAACQSDAPLGHQRAQIERTVSLLRDLAHTQDAFRVSPAQIQRLNSIHHPSTAPEPDAGSWLDRIAHALVATLIPRTEESGFAAGFRGDSDDSLRRYHAADRTLALRISPDPTQPGWFWVALQTRPAASPGSVEARRSSSTDPHASPDAAAALGEDGYTELCLESGTYDLLLTGTGFETPILVKALLIEP